MATMTSSYQTCSPHTGIETCVLGQKLLYFPLAKRAYQTCSPHTGIETLAELEIAKQACLLLTKHVPRTRGLKLLEQLNHVLKRKKWNRLPKMFPAHGD